MRTTAIRLVAVLACAALLPVSAARAGGPGGASSPESAASTPTTEQTAVRKSRPAAVRITGASCVPSVHCDGNPHQVSSHGTLLLTGTGLRAGMQIGFPKSPGEVVNSRSPIAHLRKSSAGLILTVPIKAHSGHIMVMSKGRYTGAYGPITIFAHALHPPVTIVTPPASATSNDDPLTGQGMWIWYVDKSDSGSISQIAAQAHAAGVSTVFVKSSDGPTNYWTQFSPQLVAELHANGLKVCAWQYVYGSEPVGEAELGAEAAVNGAECLVIDAEEQYEGKYAAAQTYIKDLRAKLGPDYPIGLASFPYVYYHESFPYSVFLGPEGAQFNLPQMYWKAIGQSVDTVYANTYIANRVYGRPLFPLGQTYQGVSAAELLRFREEAVDYGATGWSFWDWQETTSTGWGALTTALAPLTTVTPNATWPQLEKGEKGDQVLWMQEHLATAVPTQETSGVFDATTAANVAAFQTAHGITPSGVVEEATWVALLQLAPVPVEWTGKGPKG